LRQAFGAGGSSSRPAQPGEFADHPVHPLPSTHPSLFGIEILVLGKLARLWHELHPNAPIQLQLYFRNIGNKDNSKGSYEEATGKVLPLLTLPDAHERQPSRILADRTESSTTR
jgi:hypothetical protein